MNRSNLRIKALSLLALLGAVAFPAQAESTNTQQCVNISAFYKVVGGLKEENQLALLRMLAKPKDACEELKLGLMLSSPKASYQHDARALNLMGTAKLTLPDDAVDHVLLAALIEHIDERQKLRNMLGKQDRASKRALTRIDKQAAEIELLKRQIHQLKNLETELEDKAREALLPEVSEEPVIEEAVEETPMDLELETLEPSPAAQSQDTNPTGASAE